MTYDSLNDVAHNHDLPGNMHSVARDFEPGPIEIWYAKNPTFMDDFQPSPENLHQSHVCLGSIRGPLNRETVWAGDKKSTLNEGDLERIFLIMQGEIWSPNAEARNLIRARGLQHTSMSVGDCVKHGENIWMVANFGWKKIS